MMEKKANIEAKAAEIVAKLDERQATYLEGYVAGVAAVLLHEDKPAAPAQETEASA